MKSNFNLFLSKVLPSRFRKRFENSNFLYTFTDNIGWLLIDKALRVAISLIIGAWVARYLGPAVYGKLCLAISYVAVLGSFASLGINSIVFKDLIKQPDKSSEILGSSLILLIVASIVIFLISFFFTHFIFPYDDLQIQLILILSFGLLFKSSSILRCWFESTTKIKYIIWVENTTILFSALIKAFLLYVKAPVQTFAFVTLFESVLIWIGLYLFYTKKYMHIRFWSFSYTRVSGLLKAGWPLLATDFCLMMLARTDQIMIGKYVGSSEVAFYSIALNLIETCTFLTIALQISFMPKLNQSKKINQETYFKELNNYYVLSFICFLFMAFLIVLFSKVFILFLYGSQYQKVSTFLFFLIFRLLLSFMGVARGTYLLNEDLVRYSFISMLLGAILNISLNFYLIPHFHVYGAIFSSSISFLFVTFVCDLFYSKTRLNSLRMFNAMFNLKPFLNKI